MSWTGMRGVVTLAAASRHSADDRRGEPFPERATIQAIAFVGQRRHAAAPGLDAAAADPLAGAVISRRTAPATARRPSRPSRSCTPPPTKCWPGSRPNPPAGLDAATLAKIRLTIARHSQDADEMPDPEAHTLRAEVFSTLYREVLAAQRAALIAERDAGRIEDEAARAMLERLDLQEAGVSSRLESRF